MSNMSEITSFEATVVLPGEGGRPFSVAAIPGLGNLHCVRSRTQEDGAFLMAFTSEEDAVDVAAYMNRRPLAFQPHWNEEYIMPLLNSLFERGSLKLRPGEKRYVPADD